MVTVNGSIKPQIVGYRVYIATWAVLVTLTATTIAVYSLSLGTAGAVASIVIATIKAGLVFCIFMELRRESRFIQLILIVPVALMAVIIIFTLLDVWYR